MSKFDEYREKFIDGKNIEDIDDDHIVFFVLFFVETYCMDLCKRVCKNKVGRPPLPLKNMLALIIYATLTHENSAKKIAEFTKTDSVYKLLMEGIPVSKESVTRYRNYFIPHLQTILSKTLQLAKDLNLSNFEMASIDGTKIKAYNASFNVIRKKDLRILIKILKGKLDSSEVKNLKRTARKFYYNTKMTNEEKLELLEEMNKELKISGQKSIPVNDIEARWMYNKKEKAEISYNLQTCVDCATHLILATYVSQNPTDHYDLPIIADMAMENLGQKLQKILADAGYCTELSIQYLKENGIDGYIPNATQSRKEKDTLKTNPTSKDNIIIDYENHYIQCFAGYFLIQKYQYDEPQTKKASFGEIPLPPKIKNIYSDYESCKNCFFKEYCLTEKQKNKTYTVYGSDDMIEMLQKMETPEAKATYNNRPVVESPYGTLKQFYELNQIPYTGKIKIQGMADLKAIAYNLRIIINLVLNELLFSSIEYLNFIKQTKQKYTS